MREYRKKSPSVFSYEHKKHKIYIFYTEILSTSKIILNYLQVYTKTIQKENLTKINNWILLYFNVMHLNQKKKVRSLTCRSISGLAHQSSLTNWPVLSIEKKYIIYFIPTYTLINYETCKNSNNLIVYEASTPDNMSTLKN